MASYRELFEFMAKQSKTSSVWQCEKCGAEGSAGGKRFTLVALRIHQGKCVAADSPYGLTLRQQEVLGLIGDGLSDQQIAQQLKLSQHTVHFHISTLFEKLGVRNRAQAAVKLVRENLVPAQPSPGLMSAASRPNGCY